MSEKAQDFEEKARKLHTTVLNTINRETFDLFQRSTNGLEDTLKETAKILIEQDVQWKAKIGGPTISQIKFRPKYWNQWHKEKVLLEDISREQLLKSRKAHFGIVKSKSVSKSTVELTNPSQSKQKGTRFARTDFYTSSKSQYFDNHLLGEANNIIDMAKSHHLIEDSSPIAAATSSNPMRGKRGQMLEPLLAVPPTVTYLAGGAMSQAPRVFGAASESVTRGCEFIVLPPEAQHHLKGGAFSLERRFPYDTATTARPNSATMETSSTPTNNNNNTSAAGISFALAKRFPDNSDAQNVQNTPGPSQYKVPRLFDPNPNNLLEKRRNFDEIYEKYCSLSEGLNELPKEDLVPLVYFGQGCNPEEHIKYGMCCEDPYCCHRTMGEDVSIMLLLSLTCLLSLSSFFSL